MANDFTKAIFDTEGTTSPTRIITWCECPRQLYYNRIVKVPKVEGDDTALRFGRMMHTIFEKFYHEINFDLAKKNPQQHFAEVIAALKTKHWDYSLPTEKKKELDEIFDPFVLQQADRFEKLSKSGKTDIFFPAATEETYVSKKYKINCIIDRRNRNFVPLDYKSTKTFPDILLEDPKTMSPERVKEFIKEREKYLIQGVANALCIEDKWGTLPPFVIFLFTRHLTNTQHHGMIVIPVNQETINEFSTILKAYIKSVNAGTFPKTKDSSVCMKYLGCPYRAYCEAEDLCLMQI